MFTSLPILWTRRKIVSSKKKRVLLQSHGWTQGNRPHLAVEMWPEATLQLRACQQKLGRPRFSILRLETFDKTNPKMVQWTFGGCNEQCITSSCRCGRFFIFRGRTAWAAEVTQVTQVEIEEMALFRRRSWLYSNPLESTLEAHRRGKNTVFSTLKKQKTRENTRGKKTSTGATK